MSKLSDRPPASATPAIVGPRAGVDSRNVLRRRSAAILATVVGAAAIFFAVGWSATARADFVRTYNFTGTLAIPFQGDDLVSGFFVLDQTNATVKDFSFKTPIITVDSTNSVALVATFTPAAGPVADFVAVQVPSTVEAMQLLFETTLSSFDGSTFYTGPVQAPLGGVLSSFVAAFPPLAEYDSTFTKGIATVAIPEPPTWTALALGFLGLAGWRRVAKRRACGRRREAGAIVRL